MHLATNFYRKTTLHKYFDTLADYAQESEKKRVKKVEAAEFAYNMF